MALSLAVPSAIAQVSSVGSEYRPIGTIRGDQLRPAIALGQSRGLLTWQDQSDGDGLGIRARWLSSQGVGALESFAVNQLGAGDQERPAVVELSNGSYLIAWQSGSSGAQSIKGRFIAANGVYLTDEFAISGSGGNRDVSLATLVGGSVVAVWTGNTGSADMDDVMMAIVSPAGGLAKGPEVVNLARSGNQRDVTVAGTADGGFLVAYASDAVQALSSKIAGRRFDAAGNAVGGEQSYTDLSNPALTPSLLSVPNGFILSWSMLDRSESGSLWDIASVALDASGLRAGTVQIVSGKRSGNQVRPRMAKVGSAVVAVYESDGVDGFGVGIGARILDLSGSPTEGEFAVNSNIAGDQIGPVIASSDNQALVIWSGYAGVDFGMDLRAQRLGSGDRTVDAPSAPYVTALSSSRLLVSWSAVDGMAVSSYDVFVDGSSVPISTEETFVFLSGLAPESTHSVFLGFTLADGRKSTKSSESIGTTWGEDENSDGLPDNWQRNYFGSDETSWPDPSVDSDQDGKSNRDEYLSGTSPTDSSSVLRVDIVGSPQGAVISWNSIPGALYQLQASSDLKKWEDVGGKRMAASQRESAYLDNAPANFYYRIIFLR